MKAIVLSGGLGTRLGVLTRDCPKPILEVAGRPFLAYILDQLLLAKVDQIILSVGFNWEKIKDLIGDDWQGCPVNYSIETQPLGTGGAIQKAMREFKISEALVLNGDSFLKFDLTELYSFYQERSADIVLALKRVKNTARFGRVILDVDCRVLSFFEKQEGNSGLINTGIYYINSSIFSSNEIEKFSFENDFLSPSTASIKMYGLETKAYFIDMGIPEDLDRAQLEFKSMNEV